MDAREPVIEGLSPRDVRAVPPVHDREDRGDRDD
jgi:hypothetical protein